MKLRHGEWPHPFIIAPRAGDGEIRMQPVKALPVMRGERAEHAKQ